ncbi:MAG: hypothetical protein BYD32DRAFT_414299 [Podila humilis]|nr:MAG: hypothetical protein BYD32DRAFT_414299 [Podila humilis]
MAFRTWDGCGCSRVLTLIKHYLISFLTFDEPFSVHFLTSLSLLTQHPYPLHSSHPSFHNTFVSSPAVCSFRLFFFLASFLTISIMVKYHSILSSTLALAILLLLASTIHAAAPKCSANQELKARGFDCATCENARCVRCAVIEGPRCFCREAYIRSSPGGPCIPMEDCPHTGNPCSVNGP